MNKEKLTVRLDAQGNRALEQVKSYLQANVYTSYTRQQRVNFKSSSHGISDGDVVRFALWMMSRNLTEDGRPITQGKGGEK